MKEEAKALKKLNPFGSTLREMRIEKNLTQIKAAAKLTITQAQWSAYETGKSSMNLQTISVIAMKIEIDIQDFFKRSLEKIKQSQKL